MDQLHVNDEVGIYFKDEAAWPFRLFGKFKGQDDEFYQIVGTVGEQIGKEFLVPKSEVKLIEVTKRVSALRRQYDESWE